jgi:hemerythrin
MAIEWSRKIATGIDWQDRQHKELFYRINSLMDAMTIGLGKAEVERLFSFLDEYIIIHFDAEEQAMHKCNFPGTLSHLEEHTLFIDDVAALKEDSRNDGITTGLVIKVQSRIVEWLMNHIGTVDKELGRFIIETQERA